MGSFGSSHWIFGCYICAGRYVQSETGAEAFGGTGDSARGKSNIGYG